MTRRGHRFLIHDEYLQLAIGLGLNIGDSVRGVSIVEGVEIGFTSKRREIELPPAADGFGGGGCAFGVQKGLELSPSRFFIGLNSALNCEKQGRFRRVGSGGQDVDGAIGFPLVAGLLR